LLVTLSSAVPRNKSHLRSLGYAIAAALAVRLVVVAFLLPGFLAPERDHWEFGFETGKIARSIVLGRGFGDIYYGAHLGPTAQITPVMPHIVAAVFSVFGIHTKASAIVILSLSSLFSALTCVPVFFISWRYFGERQARWTAWIWAFFPNAIYLSTGIMREASLATLLLTCTICAVLALRDSGRLPSWLGCGLLCGLTVLTNPAALVVVPLLAYWAWRELRKCARAHLSYAAAAGLVMCAVFTPWLVRNYRTFHRPVFFKDNLPLEFCIGNVSNAPHWWDSSLHPSGNPAELEKFARLGELGYMDEKRVQAVDFLKSKPGVFVWRSLRRFIYMWTGFWSFDPKYLRDEPLDLANIPFCTANTILAGLGLRKLIRRDVVGSLPFLIVLSLFPLVYYFTHPEITYRHPIDPLVVILGSSTVLSWLSVATECESDSRHRTSDSGARPPD